jgi:AraC family transcriptional regulator
MKLEPGSYFGATMRQREEDGLSLTLSRYTPDLAQPWHVHANPTFYVLLSGQQRDRWRRAELEQPRLTLVFHPTTEPHAGLVGPEGMLGLNVEYDQAWLERHQLQERDLGSYRLLDSLEGRLAVLQLLANAFAPGPQAAAEIESQALELLESLFEPKRGHQPLARPAWLRRAQELLHDGFRLPIRVRWVAREVGVHPVHLTRVFRQCLGHSVSEYVRGLRLAEAGRLILRQGHTIAEAAHEAGFADQAHLCRCFSRNLGFSPKTLRAAVRSFSD